FRLGEGFLDDPRCGVGQRGEDSPRVEPADADFTEQVIPVDVSLLELRRRRVSPVAAAHGAADTETALGEIESIAHRAADAVVGDPADAGEINTSLQHQVLDQ